MPPRHKGFKRQMRLPLRGASTGPIQALVKRADTKPSIAERRDGERGIVS
jgi:hypothetical protein